VRKLNSISIPSVESLISFYFLFDFDFWENFLEQRNIMAQPQQINNPLPPRITPVLSGMDLIIPNLYLGEYFSLSFLPA
jgi:hypothetical protein